MDENLAIDAYKALADKCKLSGFTMRKAFSRKPITYQTARKIALRLGIPIACFVIKEDRRGKRNKL